MDSNRLVFAISELNALLMMIRVLPEQIQFSAEFNWLPHTRGETVVP